MALSRRIVSGVETPKDQWLHDAISRMMREVADELILSYGEPTRIYYDSHTAVLGTLDKNDPSGGGFTIRLPAFEKKDEGKCITICNVSTSVRPITIEVPNGSVNGFGSISVGRSKFLRQAMALDAGSNAWLLTAVSDGGTGVGEQPFWTWNGIDTTEFEGPYDGQHVTSSALSTATVAGKTWVELTMVATGNVGSNYSTKCSVIPIKVTPPSADYRITYDFCCSDFGGAYVTQGSVLRWVSSSYSGDYYAETLDDVGADVIVQLVQAGARDGSIYRLEPWQVAYETTVDFQKSEFSIRDESIMHSRCLGNDFGLIDTAGTLTAAGQPGLIAGISGGTGAKTIVALFSNIKCWEVT
jgi:hypothetical protein